MSSEINVFEAPLSGISLIEASAGTGKTYTITSLFIRIILDIELAPTNILVLTYTEMATAELKVRLRKRLKQSILALKGEATEDTFLTELKARYHSNKVPLLEKALDGFDESSVSTIHGFCQKILKEHALLFDVASDFEIMPNEVSLLQELTDRFWREFILDADSDFKKAVIQYLLDKGYYPDKLLAKVLEIIAKPYAHIVPEVPEIEEFEELYEQLRTQFEQLKTSFLKEEELIMEALKSDALNGKKYRNPEIHFETVKAWISNEAPSIHVPQKLELFGSMIHTQGEGLKKGKTIPILQTYALVDEYLETISALEQIEPAFIKFATRNIQARFQEVKSERGLLTYSDLLAKVEQGINRGGDEVCGLLRKQFPIALLDEFQDTDPIQYSIFSAIYSGFDEGALFMIGDPKQAIYSFRGADIYTYLKAKKDAFSNQVYTLNNNYRSTKTMIEGVNSLFSCSGKSFFAEKSTVFTCSLSCR